MQESKKAPFFHCDSVLRFFQRAFEGALQPFASVRTKHVFTFFLLNPFSKSNGFFPNLREDASTRELEGQTRRPHQQRGLQNTRPAAATPKQS